MLLYFLIFSTGESIQLCYTNHNVAHVWFVYVVVNNLIRAYYIIMKTTVASVGKLPVP